MPTTTSRHDPATRLTNVEEWFDRDAGELKYRRFNESRFGQNALQQVKAVLDDYQQLGS